ncbi:MAG: response regulator transcription factor [Clostridiales bacterium]|jgi:DNA-binding response OmpR family regulator|nr:response regulator transcription factor [Clostridiales bacterium]
MNGKPLVLIADDDKLVHESLSVYMNAEKYDYISAYDGEEALEMFQKNNPDIIILDIMMPKKSGVEVCWEIRKTSNVPIIMLTAKDEELDKVMGLELGADDYIVKPFSPREVTARIKTVFRRMSEVGKNSMVKIFGDLEINLNLYEVKYKGKNLLFTPKEIEILYLLSNNVGKVFSREEILKKIWGYEFFGDTRTVDTHIKKIRQKLPAEEKQFAVKSIYGIGYKFDATT